MPHRRGTCTFLLFFTSLRTERITAAPVDCSRCRDGLNVTQRGATHTAVCTRHHVSPPSPGPLRVSSSRALRHHLACTPSPAMVRVPRPARVHVRQQPPAQLADPHCAPRHRTPGGRGPRHGGHRVPGVPRVRQTRKRAPCCPSRTDLTGATSTRVPLTPCPARAQVQARVEA